MQPLPIISLIPKTILGISRMGEVAGMYDAFVYVVAREFV